MSKIFKKSATVILLLSCVLCCFTGCKETEETVVTATETITEATTEKETTETIAEEETTENSVLFKLAYSAYLTEIKRVEEDNRGGPFEDGTRFYLHDFDNNGMPELIIYHGYKTNTFEEGYGVYTYEKNTLVFLGSADAHSTYFYDKTPGDNEFNVICFYHGHSAEFHYKIEDNHMIETTVTAWREVLDTENSYENEEVYERIKPYLLFELGEWPYASEADEYFANL